MTKMEKFLIVAPAFNVGLAPMWLAVDHGFFAEEGLDAGIHYILGQKEGQPGRFLGQRHEGKPILFDTPGGSAVFQAVREGRQEINVVSLVKRPFHVFVGRPEIRSIPDLKGKRIATATVGASSVDSRVVLRRFGLDPDRDVDLVPSEGKPPDTERARLEAFKSGDVVAVCSDPPHWNIAIRMGGHRLPSARDFYRWPEDGLSTTKEVIRERPDLVKKAVRAAIKAADFARKNKEATVQAMLKHNRFVEREVAEECWDYLKDDWGPVTDLDAFRQKIEAYTLEWKLPSLPFEQYYELRFVREALEELGLGG